MSKKGEKSKPSPNGSNRDSSGRFTKGNSGGPGNPYAQQVAKLRSSLMAAVTTNDVKAIVKKLVALARSGDVPAAKLVLGRIFGPEIPVDIIARLEDLENELKERQL